MEDIIAKCEQMRCELNNETNKLVFGRGNPNAQIMIIGEAPGAKENETGLPFVGAAGKKLSALLNHAQIDEQTCYIANILKYRPPNNKNPTKRQISIHTPYLMMQIERVAPKIIVTLGNYSTKFMIEQLSEKKETPGISKLHGKLIQTTPKLFPLYHPAALLYNPNLQEETHKDLKKLKKHLAEI